MLSIVIVTRNTRALLEALLGSIEADGSLKPILDEVVVVDNGSTDDTSEMIGTKFPRVSYVRNDENRGFAAAVNMGYRKCTGRFILFLNSDTRVIPGEIPPMLRFMQEEPHAGIVGPQLVYEDLRPQRSFAITPGLALELLPRAFVERFIHRGVPTKGARVTAPVDVDSLVGAAIMVRRDVLDVLDGFDERFFFFLEETDLCLRAAGKGYRVMFFPHARVVHLQGKTVSRSWAKGRIEYAISLYKFLKKYHSPGYLAAFIFVRIWKALLFLVAVSVVPLILVKQSMRRKSSYYVQLVAWHLRGCPDDAGLKG